MKLKKSEKIKEVITILNELEEDLTVPKNVKLKIKKIIETLRDTKDLSMKVSKVLTELDEIADDTNMQSYTRTQLYGIVSLLEKV